MTRPQHLLLAGVVLVGVGVGFYVHQNAHPALGGRISVPAAAWLTYALAAFFVIPAWFAADKAVAPALRRLYGVHLAFWGLRAALELPLMYGVHAWRPAYGLVHDAAAIALILALAWRWRTPIAKAEGASSRAARGFLLALVLAISCEGAFAWLFNQATAGQTATWWFPDDTPRFHLLNHLTASACGVLFPLSIYTLLRDRVSGPTAEKSS